MYCIPDIKSTAADTWEKNCHFFSENGQFPTLPPLVEILPPPLEDQATSPLKGRLDPPWKPVPCRPMTTTTTFKLIERDARVEN